MAETKKVGLPHVGWGYRLYKRYVQFFQEHLMYRRVYYVHRENVPSYGTPVMLVSNHQNCANDPLGLLIGLENRCHPFVMARADAFELHPLVTKFFFWLGMLPAFRLDYDGEASLSKNYASMRLSGEKMLEGNPIIMYPEGTHQQGRYLGEFKFGYTRLAFQAAEVGGFEKEVFILPTANHYDDYFTVRGEFMVTFGTPISLQPWYEMYKTKPRTAQREVNRLVRKQIEDMMLDVKDVEHYDAVDFIRTTYGLDFAGGEKALPEQLASDKQLCARLEEVREQDAAAVERVYEEALALKAGEEKLGLNDADFHRKPCLTKLVLSAVAQVLLLPLWVFTLYPSVIFYGVPRLFLKEDKMWTNTLVEIFTIVVLMPLAALLVLLVTGLVGGGWWWLVGAVWGLSFLPICLFCWYDWRWMRRTLEGFRFLCHKKEVQGLRQMRERLFNALDKIIKTK